MIKATQTSSVTHQQSTIIAMHVGWMFTIAALAAVWVDHATANALAHHIQVSYPHYSKAHIDSAAATYIIYLSVVGALGLIAWLSSIRAVNQDKRWIRPAATLIFILATSLSLTDLLIRDTSGDTGLPALLGWIGMLPSLPGLVTLNLLWKDRKVTPASRASQSNRRTERNAPNHPDRVRRLADNIERREQ